MTDQQDELGVSPEKAAGIQPVELISFILGCVRKHVWISLAVFLLISVPGVLVARMLPLQYATRARILVQKKEGISARVLDSGNPERSEELNAVQDKLLRLDNLRGVVADMNLEATWDDRRPPLVALKDRIRGGGLSSLPKEDRIRALIGTVESRLTITADTYGGVLTIEGNWTDPKTAFDLVDAVKTRYLNDRLRAEVQVFNEVIAILEQQKRDAGREVEQGLLRVEQAGWRPGAATEAAPSAAGSEDTSALASKSGRMLERVTEPGAPDAASIVKLEAIRRQIKEVQDPWHRRLSELKLQLSDLSSHYGPKHPLVVNQEHRIEEASAPPAGLEALRAQEAQLSAAVEESSRPKERIVIRNLGSPQTEAAGAQAPKDNRVRVESSATLSTEQSKLIQAVNKYNGLVERIDRTRMELNTASTAFKYRFNVVQQPEMPNFPTKPKLRLFAAVGAIAFGALLALAIGPLRELLSGKFAAPWQAKTLGIPLLGELCLSEEESR